MIVSTDGLPEEKASCFLTAGNGVLGPAIASRTLKVDLFFGAAAGGALEDAIILGGTEVAC